MKAYLLADITVHDRSKFSEYMGRMPEYVEMYGGKYLVRGARPMVIEGSWQPDTCVLIEFPSHQSLSGFMTDTSVLALFSIRQQSTTSKIIVMDGCESV